ncbi:MAG: NAD(+) kinase [Candidatus Baumannia cicadellinicola]|nr:NAD(+) kinase [Candidatus Baumannia cicadellinicola]
MTANFKTIGILGKHRDPNALVTHETLYYWLIKQGIKVIIEPQMANNLSLANAITGNVVDIGEQADLVIIVGGDGNILGAARILSRYDIKIIGINRGNVGFLADLDPDEALTQLSDVLVGNYNHDKRFLLEVSIYRNHRYEQANTAINEIVLHSGKVAHMIEFDVFIDNCFAFSLRSDGLIISTPTGSTAYSLSAGGPILTPTVDTIVLVPMFPHTLSSRPLVIHGSSTIRLKFSQWQPDMEISCDSQIIFPVHHGDEIIIRRSDYYLDLIHPNDYNYFNILSRKLGWSKKFC